MGWAQGVSECTETSFDGAKTNGNYPAMGLLFNDGCSVCGLCSLVAANIFMIYMHAAAACERNGGGHARGIWAVFAGGVERQECGLDEKDDDADEKKVFLERKEDYFGKRVGNLEKAEENFENPQINFESRERNFDRAERNFENPQGNFDRAERARMQHTLEASSGKACLAGIFVLASLFFWLEPKERKVQAGEETGLKIGSLR